MKVHFYFSNTINFLNLFQGLLTNVSQTLFPGWFSAQKIHSTTAHLSCLNSASENVWRRTNVCRPVLFILTNTISFYTSGGKEKGTKEKKIFVFSQLLSNIENWKGTINSRGSPKQQQQDEINWEGSLSSSYFCWSRKSVPESTLALSSEMQNLSDTSQNACVICYEVFQIGRSGTWWAKI